MNSAFGGSDVVDSPSSVQTTGPQSLEQMSDVDKFGLPGLLSMMHHPSADIRSLVAQGQDLTTLGLDLISTEPLHTHLASVFNPTAHTRLPLDADYTLPACYRVANVQALQERIPSFSEETLFYIYYSRPKDLVQELVAEELIGRKWRFHKGENMWVTRDENYPAPAEMEREISEQGFYIWWDWKGWKKIRVSSARTRFTDFRCVGSCRLLMMFFFFSFINPRDSTYCDTKTWITGRREMDLR